MSSATIEPERGSRRHGPEDRPPLVTDAQRWRWAIFDDPRVIAIWLMDDSRVRYGLDDDTRPMTTTLTKRGDPAWTATPASTRPAPGPLAMEGTLDGWKIRARMRRVDASDFRSINRGFHWISEYPLDR